jgi:hypothetical protein
MLPVGHQAGARRKSRENADNLPATVNHRRKPRGCRRLRHEPGIRGGNQQGTQKPRHRPETAMRFLVHNLDAIATVVAGIWATHVAWRRGGAAIPGMDAAGWPERSIGPLLIAFAVVEFVIAR